MDNKETRAFSFEVRAEQNEQHGTFITGTPIVFDQATDMGWYEERIDKDALMEKLSAASLRGGEAAREAALLLSRLQPSDAPRITPERLWVMDMAM